MRYPSQTVLKMVIFAGDVGIGQLLQVSLKNGFVTSTKVLFSIHVDGIPKQEATSLNLQSSVLREIIVATVSDGSDLSNCF